uniref:Uncharacterized protein n=1 Tax=Timema poppense TaxID=170557 RepID=A0A7R9HBH2_TIMPO|nr:unnamed protein product [Timema poppensis]
MMFSGILLLDVGGVITKSLTDTEATQISITGEQALLLGQLGLRVEAAFGTPRDIEWAISQLFTAGNEPLVEGSRIRSPVVNEPRIDSDTLAASGTYFTPAPKLPVMTRVR